MNDRGVEPSFNQQANVAGKKRAEQVLADPATRSFFLLGFIDGAYWAAHLIQAEQEKNDE